MRARFGAQGVLCRIRIKPHYGQQSGHDGFEGYNWRKKCDMQNLNIPLGMAQRRGVCTYRGRSNPRTGEIESLYRG